MENKKTEKKRIFSKLTVCVAALALVSCAFVGGTFARYQTIGAPATGGANIADWYIDVMDGSDSTDVVFTISPNDVEYTSTDRTNKLGGGTSLALVNRGEVAADVTITVSNSLVVIPKSIDANGNLVEGIYNTAGELVTGKLESDVQYVDRAGNTFTWTVSGTSMKPEFTAKGASVKQDDYNDLVAAWQSVSLYDGTNGIIQIGTLTVSEYTADGNPQTPPDSGIYTLNTNDRLEVTITSATWTSDFTSDNDNKGDYGDIRDTWIGENIAKIGYTISWDAVQSSVYQQGTITG